MPVFAVGGEADSFDLPAGHSYAVSTNVAHYDSAISRCAMIVTTGTSELELPLNQTGGVSTLYIHFNLYQESVALANYIDIYNEAKTQVQYRIRMDASGTWTAQRFNGTAFVDIGTTSATMAINGAITVDMKIVQSATIGEFNIKRNNVDVLNITAADTSTPATMGVVRFVGLAGGTNRMMISQVIVGDETFLNWKLATLAPVATGTFGAWTGDYTAVDEVAYNNADFIETNSLNQIETMNVTDIPASLSTYNVKSIVTTGIFSNDAGSAVNDTEFALQTNGTTQTTPANVVKDGSEQVKQAVFATNPATGNPWTQAEVNTLEIGVKSV